VSLIKFLIALAFTSAFRFAFADSPCPNVNATPESHKCMEAKIAEAEALLDRYIYAAQTEAAGIGSTEPPKLANTQTLWLKYRDSQCGDAYLFWLAGSYRYEATLKCELELTRSRTHEIWSTFLVRFGTGPPVLPEP